ncbi:2-amino-4-hydroxy-6-hydroxymethyldihydropteridine diphosphokinase [Effusibacillus consociatus]|uniref:2-amino-4-hydroxy-6-hydroxymethyldihydropteridine diphosphokinase n=1 Tax=Effusibacillus consociatus TaxID=1117041 RepID=A0ABV9Q0N6_9BACL
MADGKPVPGENEIYLALGTNLGDRYRYLAAAIDSLQRRGISVLDESPIYETEAVGDVDQPDFLNMVVQVSTHLSPNALLAEILAIEKEHGRVRDKKWGPRTLDLDILFYGKLIIEDPDLVVPHPLIHQRAFVLLPLRDLVPGFVHPVLGLTIEELAERVPGKEGVRRWEKHSANGCVHIEN